MHQITDFLQFTCIINTFYENPLKSLLVCKVFFEMTAGNTVEICPKYEIYHEIYTCN